mgnify:CR=1 FL=1
MEPLSPIEYQPLTMIMKRLFPLLALLSTAVLVSSAQTTNLPPCVAATNDAVRADHMDRAYITPRRVMWTSNPLLFGNTDLLLRPNTGQAEVGDRNMCAMTTTATDTASLIIACPSESSVIAVEEFFQRFSAGYSPSISDEEIRKLLIG